MRLMPNSPTAMLARMPLANSKFRFVFDDD